ncbi:hypothetical protein I6F66_02845 [Pseudoalteromonas sp. NZS100_1]|uniref:hypothetical protein n=1 Tax=Pseudoalteromonas sp. NZS100_1 TaxID=2792073 RepID=UPI0018CEEDA2|nr:hypothetical protein [Pseudoalteromonas sp. NZS100_1]MBH0011010.1 hypothetical protein [Pseudoalteromonas sp. NZS100_1]
MKHLAPLELQSNMLRKLDKYLDDVVSPYWEILLYFLLGLFMLTGLIVIFFCDKSLADKFSSFGSFAGFLVSIAAFIYARREYLRQRGLNERVGMQTGSLPKLRNYLTSNVVMIASNFHSVTKGFKSNDGELSGGFDELEELEKDDIRFENNRLEKELHEIWQEFMAQKEKAFYYEAKFKSNFACKNEELENLILSLQDVLFLISFKLNKFQLRSNQSELLAERITDNAYYKLFIEDKFDTWDSLDKVDYDDVQKRLRVIVNEVIESLKF